MAKRKYPEAIYLAAKELIIEIDGDYHNAIKEKDSERDAYFKEFNFRILRFNNHEIVNNMESVLKRIKRNLLENNLNPDPSPMEEKGEKSSPPQERI